MVLALGHKCSDLRRDGDSGRQEAAFGTAELALQPLPTKTENKQGATIQDLLASLFTALAQSGGLG